MKKQRLVALFLCLGLLFASTAQARKKKTPVDPSLYQGQTAEAAMQGLLSRASEVVDDGTWETINVARVMLLGGQKDQGKELLDQVAAKADASDWVRIGRVYQEAGDWPAAKHAFEEVLTLKPRDADWLAEIGGFFNLAGDRERAEELFGRSFALEPNNYRNLLKAAGSYTGVRPD